MATIAKPRREPASDDRFFLRMAIAMALTVAAAFSLQLAAGRSSFGAPALIHAHAIVFMGWIVIFLTQALLATRGPLALHRKLGWIAAGWVVAMVGMGVAVTIFDARMGRIPFIFRPLHFLVFDPMSLFGFAGLTAAAIVQRRRTDWHRRLHFSGMTLMMGPAFGRLLPMPLLIPHAWEAAAAATFIFPAIGVVGDLRRDGRVHPAWWWGIGAIVATYVLTELITYSPLGAALYALVTAGSPGAAFPPLDFPPPMP
jgi:hypothetical protein